jgi:allophanate hydrolase subunit 1
VVLELEPRSRWKAKADLAVGPAAGGSEEVEAIPGMNNITVVLRNPQEMAWDAIERLQRWWEESDALEPESRR